MKQLFEYALSESVTAWKLFLIICFLSLLFYGILNLILQIIHKSIRAKTIRLKGYPPLHCDGDGDINTEAGISKDKGLFPIK